MPGRVLDAGRRPVAELPRVRERVAVGVRAGRREPPAVWAHVAGRVRVADTVGAWFGPPTTTGSVATAWPPAPSDTVTFAVNVPAEA